MNNVGTGVTGGAIPRLVAQRVIPEPDVTTAAAAALADALIDRHLIGVAVGIVAVQRRQTPREALESLVGIAHRTDRSVVEVARHLVARRSHTGRSATRSMPIMDSDLDPAA